MGLWDSVKRFFGGGVQAPTTPSAADVMRDLRNEKGRADPEWERLNNRLATLVLSESDRQRIWKRAHRTAEGSARLLSGITTPTGEERRILGELVKELEAGR